MCRLSVIIQPLPIILAILALSSRAAPSFDDQRKAIASSIQTQPESAVIALLEAGLREGKPALALADAEKWLQQNLPDKPILLYHAGRAAEMSGGWKNAIGLYQRYLTKADLKSATADDAVYAVYTLLLHKLHDGSSAYLFSRTDGHRLLACPRARQFDEWFLREAMTRKDAVAVSRRLTACAEALPEGLLLTQYSKYFRWLLSQIDTYLQHPHALPITDELHAAVEAMCNSMSFNDELKLQLDWLVSVKAYNLGRLGHDAKKHVAPPIAEATALLDAFPRHAQWVQDGWAGGGNGRHHRGDPKRYWSHEIDAKMAPVVAAAEKLKGLDRCELVRTWRSGYYQDEVVRPLQVKTVRDYVTATPNLTESRHGPLLLDEPWNKISPERAMALAPKLATSADSSAALIRAIAAGGKEKNFDKAFAALLGPEAWRFGGSIDMKHAWGTALHDYYNKPGGKAAHDKAAQRMAEVAKGVAAQMPQPDAPAEQRLAAFRKLWTDYRSPQPKEPAVWARLVPLLGITPDALPELLTDPNADAQMLARHVVHAGASGPEQVWKNIHGTAGINVRVYAPRVQALADKHTAGSVPQLKKRFAKLCVAHPLEPALRQSITEGIKRDNVQAWQVIAWINMQYPENTAEQIDLMRTLLQSSAWQTLPSAVRHAARLSFGVNGMTATQAHWLQASNPAIYNKDLLALPEAAGAHTAAAALRKAIDGAKASPVHTRTLGLENLLRIHPAVFADPKVFDLVLEAIDSLRLSCDRDTHGVAARVLNQVGKSRDPVALHRTAAYLWSFGMSEHYAGSLPRVHQLAESLLASDPASAGTLATVGLAVSAHGAQHHQLRWLKAGRPALKKLKGKAAFKTGLVVIPVIKSHAAYPVYKSQSEWMIANEDSAWKLLDEHWVQLQPIQRQLSTSYLLWALRRTITSRDEARQEALATALLDWSRSPGNPWTTAQKIDLEIAYGDIAMQRGRLDAAHRIFAEIQRNPAYAKLPYRHQATLRRVRVERIAKRFDEALATLMKLDMARIPEMWVPSRYARAEIYYDMENFADAADDVAAILAHEPTHPDAKIMEGKIQLKRKKLMEASELDFGSRNAQRTMVPGESLKVTLSDPALAVSGAGTEIEVVVTATSGDKEHFLLRQFGDEKTKFRGEVKTTLGKAIPGDRTLQVIGDDEIYYAYSDRFCKKMNNMDAKRGGPITVKSDAILMASARELLSESEQRVADMKREMDAISSGRSRPLSAARQAVMLAQKAITKAQQQDVGHATEEAEKQVLAASLARTLVKPGRSINVRVIDPDRSRTAEVDKLAVTVESSSGDSIARVVLTETDSYSGWFEGTVPTDNAQAMAFAEASQPGCDPNMVISPNTDYPAWRPAPGRKQAITIDLNDNVALGAMTISAGEPNAKLERFIVQTGMDAGTMRTVGVFPIDQSTPQRPFHPSITVMNDSDHHHHTSKRSVYEITQMEHHLTSGWITQAFPAGITETVVGPSAILGKEIPSKVDWKNRRRWPNACVIYRFRGYFYESTATARRFKLELGKFVTPKNTPPAQFMLSVDGQPITNKATPTQLQGEVTLKPGLHRFEVWSTGWNHAIGFGRTAKLLTSDDDTPGEWVDCADNFFDPATFPRNAVPRANGRATISADAAGGAFKVAFAKGSRARLIRLIPLNRDGAAPALNKIKLSSPEGERILPVKEDYARLNKNKTLEILSGDRITIRYVDDRFVSKRKQRLERFLDVSFSNARVNFQFFEMRENRDGEPVPFSESLFRFAHNEPLCLAVIDPDMNTSDKRDVIDVTLEANSGSRRMFKASETSNSSGVFHLFITPVPGSPTSDRQFQVDAGGTITATYRDAENLTPGIAVDREATIRHAVYSEPKLYVSHASVIPLENDSATMRDLPVGFSVHDAPISRPVRAGLNDPEESARPSGGTVRPRWLVNNTFWRSDSPPDDGYSAVHGRLLHLEVEAPHLALRASSSVSIFVQTDTGRKRAPERGQDAADYDISVPGTIRLDAKLIGPSGRPRALSSIRLPTYVGGAPRHLDDMKPVRTSFACAVPLISGFLPTHGASKKPKSNSSALAPAGLVVAPGDRVHVGFRYTDHSGAKRWSTASAKVISHPTFDIMQESFRDERKTAYVGETLHLRVVDLGADLSDRSDTVTVLLQAKSGAKHRVELQEIDTHTGIFKASFHLSYAQDGAIADAGHNVRLQGFPVTYNDQVRGLYKDSQGRKSNLATVTICKGGDGSVTPFSKQYNDPSIAMRTQFALAEAFLEMAKRHRKLGENELAADEYARAKDMLEKTMEIFEDPDTRAQAEYLLANLTQEEADATTDPELREQRYRAALSRYLRVTGSYADTLPASKAQFKIATVYEHLNEPDIAAQEYVKLAYKYPDSEFLALSMARLGTHFQRRAAKYEKQAEALLGRTADKDAQFDGLAMQKMMIKEYRKSAEIFARLQARFPDHALAGKGGLRAGQTYMRAGDYQRAIVAFLRVIDNTSYDGAKVRAQAMYWAGMCYESTNAAMAAYSQYKRLTYDFPESKWASYARGQLSQNRLLDIEDDLEKRRLETGL